MGRGDFPKCQNRTRGPTAENVLETIKKTNPSEIKKKVATEYGVHVLKTNRNVFTLIMTNLCLLCIMKHTWNTWLEQMVGSTTRGGMLPW
jgi:hypothetical protein